MTTTAPKLGRFGIPLTDTDAAQAYIDSIEGRATRRCVSADELTSVADAIEGRLDQLGVYQKDRPGITAHVDGSEHLPAAYGHGAQATFCEITRRTGGWYLTAASRGWNRPRQGHDVDGIDPATLAAAAYRYLGGL